MYFIVMIRHKRYIAPYSYLLSYSYTYQVFGEKRAPQNQLCMVITYSKGKDRSGKVANPARGQLNMEN